MPYPPGSAPIDPAAFSRFLKILYLTREEAIPFFVAAVALFLLCYPRVPPAPGSPTG